MEVKSFLFGTKRSERKIKFGLFRGLTIPLDLTSELQIYLGTWEREHYAWTHQLTRGIQTYIDVGANAGLMTAYGMAKTSAQRILAFEPDPTFHNRIREAVDLNGFDTSSTSLSVHDAFVSDREEEGHVCLDAFAAEIEYPCFLKVDVDGGEHKVLEGATQVLKNGDARLLVETHSRKLEDECIDYLSDLGYETKVIENAWWRSFLPDGREGAHNQWFVAHKT